MNTLTSLNLIRYDAMRPTCPWHTMGSPTCLRPRTNWLGIVGRCLAAWSRFRRASSRNHGGHRQQDQK